MSELTEKLKAKYPQYANIPDAELEQKVLAKYPQYQSMATPKEKSFLQKAGGLAMNVLNAPSYFAGGAIKGLREGGLTGLMTMNPLRQGIKGVYQGFTGQEAPTVYGELPKALGLQEGSTASKAVGLAGELLTPQIPLVGMAGRGAKALGITGKVASGAQKVAGVGQDAAQRLLEMSYKLNRTNIDDIAKAIGATNEATKAQEVVRFLESQGMRGATRGSMETLNRVISPVQEKYNAMVKTGRQVPRSEYAKALLDQAVELEQRSDDPGTRQVVKQLLEEADFQMKKGGMMTDTGIVSTKDTAFANTSNKAINDPHYNPFNEQVGRAGVRQLETLAPGSQKVGKQLRGLRSAQEVVGGQANTGLGTQLINTLKPSGFGFLAGSAYGAYSGENPLTSGLKGLAIGAGVNNPKVLNVAGKTLQKVSKVPQVPKVFGKVAGRSIDTAIRSPLFTKSQSPQEKVSLSPMQSKTSLPPVSPIIQPSASPIKRQVTPFRRR